MRTNKIMLLASLPVLGICATSCNSRSKAVSYDEALTHVINNYDEHALDYVKGNYTEKINKCNVDLDVTEVNSIGIEKKYNVAVGLDNITVKYDDIEAIVLNSSYFKLIEKYYNDICQLTFEKFTDFKLNKTYTLNNGNLEVKIGTNDSITELLIVANNLLDLAFSAPEMIPEQYRKMVETYLNYVPTKIKSFYENYSISIASTSTTTGELSMSLATDNDGFITYSNFTFETAIDAAVSVTSREYSIMSYDFRLNGQINYNVDLNVTF